MDRVLRRSVIPSVSTRRPAAALGAWIDRGDAAVQDALFNEPWFVVEGCLWAAFALRALSPSSRKPWLRTALAAGAVACAFGLLTALGAAPSWRYG